MEEKHTTHRLAIARVVLVAAAFHLAVAALVAYRFDWNLSGLIRINTTSAERNRALMTPGLVVLTNSTGFDGKENYFVAVDPFPGPDYSVPYRLKRILYPLAAHAIALGHRSWLPFSLFVVNLLAVLAGTAFLASYLAQSGRPPVLALVYSLSIGELVGLKYTLTTPLSTALAVGGLCLWYRRRDLGSAVLFALSLLANEYTLVLPIALVIEAAFRKEIRRALWLAATPVPWALYLAFIVHRYSRHAVTDAAEVFARPFQGVLDILHHINPGVGWQRFCYQDIAPLVFLLLVILMAATEAAKLRARLAPAAVLILYYIVFSVFLKEDCWRIINISRYLSPVFPLFVVNHVEQPGRFDRWVFAASLAFSAAALAGVLVEPRVPFTLWP